MKKPKMKTLYIFEFNIDEVFQQALSFTANSMKGNPIDDTFDETSYQLEIFLRDVRNNRWDDVANIIETNPWLLCPLKELEKSCRAKEFVVDIIITDIKGEELFKIQNFTWQS